MKDSPKKIIFATNSSHHAWRHRSELSLAALRSGFDVYFMSPLGDEVNKLTSLGIKHIPIDLDRKGVNPFRELLSLWQIYNAIKKNQPDIFHGFTIKLLIYGGLCCRWLKIKKYYLNVTGIGSLFLSPSNNYVLVKRWVSKLYRWSFNSNQATAIFQNISDQQFFIEHGWVKKSQSIVIPGTGIDTHSIVPSFSTRNRKIQILYAGRIIKDKGIEDLIDAGKILKEKNLDFEIIIYGKLDQGNPSAFDQEEWDGLCKYGFIKWKGYKENLKNELTNCDLVCLPSYREGLPLFLLEAGAYGKPSVTTDVPGCRDIISQEKNGLIVPIKNPEKLSEALEALILHPDLRYKMGKAARKYIEENFDEKNILTKYINLYLAPSHQS